MKAKILSTEPVPPAQPAAPAAAPGVAVDTGTRRNVLTGIVNLVTSIIGLFVWRRFPMPTAGLGSIQAGSPLGNAGGPAPAVAPQRASATGRGAARSRRTVVATAASNIQIGGPSHG